VIWIIIIMNDKGEQLADSLIVSLRHLLTPQKNSHTLVGSGPPLACLSNHTVPLIARHLWDRMVVHGRGLVRGYNRETKKPEIPS